MALEPSEWAVESGGVTLSGETMGEGPSLALLHGLTATRRSVVHGSKYLPRNGFRTLAYDARGHGRSSPAPGNRGYGYPGLVSDLGAVIEEREAGRVALVGHSMGAHTAVAHALDHADEVAALVLIGPVWMSIDPDEATLRAWDELADGLERDGVEGFNRAYDRDLDPKWRDTLLRITRERLEEHEYPEAVAQALREVPRSRPFESMSELEFLDVPTLVVGSRDDADRNHPLEVARAYAESLPDARLLCEEEEGRSPLAWQGGRLSREIASFCAEPAVRERLGA